jgi:uncharacterized membrane protein YkoI
MEKRTKIITGAAVVAVGVLAAAGTVLAGDDGSDLDGPTLDRAREAALAETGPGRVTGAEQEDGGYELEVVRPDGVEVDVYLDRDLSVVRTDPDDDDRNDDGDDGVVRGDGREVDADDLTGDVRDRAVAAATAEVPGGIVTDAEHADGPGYEVTIVRPDGAEVDVRLDEAFAVTSAVVDLDD